MKVFQPNHIILPKFMIPPPPGSQGCGPGPSSPDGSSALVQTVVGGPSDVTGTIPPKKPPRAQAPSTD